MVEQTACPLTIIPLLLQRLSPESVSVIRLDDPVEMQSCNHNCAWYGDEGCAIDRIALSLKFLASKTR